MSNENDNLITPDSEDVAPIDYEAKANEYLQGWQRAQADYQNLQREWQERQRQFMPVAREQLLLEIVPVLDNLKQALLHTPTEVQGGEWIKGLEYIETQWIKLLDGWGIEMINTTGQIFDAKQHEAVGTDEAVEEGMIAREVQGGYKSGERVLVPARVIVGSKKV